MTTSLLDISPVVPVVVLDRAEDAVPVARALVAGGVSLIEVTLRTPVAIEAIRRIAAEVPEINVGAGTIVTPADARAAVAVGAGFLVSPGSTAPLVSAARECGVPYLPGASTVSEVLTLLDLGFGEMKFFPAQASGGVDFLKSLAPVTPGARFCPTGGVSVDNAAQYLALPNVGCVGGSWLTPRDAVTARDFSRITELARAATALRAAK